MRFGLRVVTIILENSILSLANMKKPLSNMSKLADLIHKMVTGFIIVDSSNLGLVKLRMQLKITVKLLTTLNHMEMK